MKILARLRLFFGMIMIIAFIGLILVIFAINSTRSSSDFSENIVVKVPEGAGLNQVASVLSDSGVIDNELLFKVNAYRLGIESQWKAGEFEIPAGASIEEMQELLTDAGQAVRYKITFPEGLSSFEIVQRLNAAEGLEGEITDIPPEGSIATSTFDFESGQSRQSIIELAQAYQSDFLQNAWENRADDLPLSSPEEMLILASIVEKEAGNAEELPVVASVFINRLRIGMKLQTDASVLYGITLGREKLGRGIRRSELRAETPYNTYVIEGLPPTPIANPGRAAIEAVANPAETDFIYFVAKTLSPSDGHAFAVTLDEHNANVAKYRALEASQ